MNALIQNKGNIGIMCAIYVAEHHDQLLDLWREQDARSLQLVHLDFHCDMRGLLIDRKAGLAFRIPDFFSQEAEEGNFLTHAVLEGRVKSMRWIHDEPGGRRDDVGTVKYESDLTALPFRLFNFVTGRKGISIAYKEVPYKEWSGLHNGEVLSIDWDFFACRKYPADSVHRRVESFLNLELQTVPKQVFICYSPQHCHPSREEFREFVSSLGRLFQAEVVALKAVPTLAKEPAFLRKYMPTLCLKWCRRLYYGVVLSLRKIGIY